MNSIIHIAIMMTEMEKKNGEKKFQSQAVTITR